MLKRPVTNIYLHTDMVGVVLRLFVHLPQPVRKHCLAHVYCYVGRHIQRPLRIRKVAIGNCRG
jgi:hypothetical protein